MRIADPSPGSDRNSSGIAMVAALGLMAVAAAVMVLLFMRTMDEVRHGQDDTGIVQTLLVAHGGANMGVTLLRSDIREHLDSIATTQSDSTAPWSFGSSGINDTRPTFESVAQDLGQVAAALQQRIDALVCGEHEFSQGQTLTLHIYVTELACGEFPLPDDTRLGEGRFVQGNRRELGGEQRYAIPFVMVAEGRQGQYRRRVITQGEYQFDVGRVSFARYALFTNRHVSESGSGRIWFTNDTLFDGPVHTNGNFNFFGRPWFGGDVTSAGASQGLGQGAFGYNNSDGQFFSATSLDSQGNAPDLSTGSHSNRPTFAEGVDFRAAEIELPSNAHDQRKLADENGILFTGNMEYLRIFAADENGNAIPANSTRSAAYQYVEARTQVRGNMRTVTYRIDPHGRLERQDDSDDDWTLETATFNGVIYSDEYIPQLEGPGRSNESDPASARPALAAFSQLTIVPEEGARITGDLVYEDEPCAGSLHRNNNNDIVRAVCENLDAINVLGIFTPEGNIDIGHNNGHSRLNAPEDVRIQASLLTSNGVVRVENYNHGSARGAVSLLGGIIEERYGAFGTFNSSSGTMSTGYAREFTFDPRLRRGITPPFFPTVGLDGVKNVFTFTFGHREQVF